MSPGNYSLPRCPTPRGRCYYQEIAVNRATQAVLQGRRRIPLTLCTGSGKTAIAFQICWKLWSARWNRTGAVRRPKILFLSDRSVLVDDPMAKDFSPFADARHKISGTAVKSRDMYFAIYQAIARDEQRPGLYREYPPGFFDLIIVDECHRGSARDDSNWRLNEGRDVAVLMLSEMRNIFADPYRHFHPVSAPHVLHGTSHRIRPPHRSHWRVYRVA